MRRAGSGNGGRRRAALFPSHARNLVLSRASNSRCPCRAQGTDNNNSAFMLAAQNRGLATNLHRYRRRIAELDAALQESELARRSATDALSVVQRRVALFEDDLATVEVRLQPTSSGGALEHRHGGTDSATTNAENGERIAVISVSLIVSSRARSTLLASTRAPRRSRCPQYR